MFAHETIEKEYTYSTAEYRIMKTGIAVFNERHFRIPYPIAQRHFKTHFLLHWSASYCLSRLTDCYGVINHLMKDSINYHIRFAKNQTRGRILELAYINPSIQIPISFRCPNDEWSLLPIVMIGEEIL